MPRNQGTSRKGKPKRNERAAGMGRALEKSTQKRFQPKSNGSSRGAGMAMAPGTSSIGMGQDDDDDEGRRKTLSVLEMDDLTDFLHQAEMAGREFASERERFLVVDETSTEYRHEAAPRVSWSDEPRKNRDGFVFKELSLPRRPPWDETTTQEQLDERERESFLEWRRSIALREEQLLLGHDGGARVTPFEKNLEVWRQLWRVLERCSCVLQIVDARNPLFYLSSDLRSYATVELNKPMLLLVNKSDYLSSKQRRFWHEYFQSNGWSHVFYSAHLEQEKLDAAAQAERRGGGASSSSFHDEHHDDADTTEQEENKEDAVEEEEERNHQEEQLAPRNNSRQSSQTSDVGIENPLTRLELLEWMKAFALRNDCKPDPRQNNTVMYGLIGFPNVGKSSVINSICMSSKHTHGIVRVGVASQPGKTKHFQTLFVPDQEDMMLCDCPGLVFPSFVSSTADLIAAGVFPIAQMRDPWPVVELICKRIPREILNAQYGIQLPTPNERDDRYEGDDPAPPTGEELLNTFCVARSMLSASSGVPDHQKASRIVIKDYAEGKLLYCHAPPSADGESFHRETIVTALSRTRKLREKFGSVLEQAKIASTDAPNKERDETDSADDTEDDLDILEALEVAAEEAGGQNATNGGKRGKRHKSIQKHGRKGRKDRNKDPYGCHSTPDDSLLDSRWEGGVIVNAGKHGRKGYTRPTNFSGPRAFARCENEVR